MGIRLDGEGRTGATPDQSICCLATIMSNHPQKRTDTLEGPMFSKYVRKAQS